MRKVSLFAALAAVVLFTAGQAFAAVDAADLFTKKCAMCHGKTGDGSAMAPALKGNEFIKGDAAAIKTTILEGRKGDQKKYPKFTIAMPAFKTLTEEEQGAIVDFLKGLK